nr:MAG TPA: hypothetical protein [Caudoviricetes sp.]
MPLRMQRLLRSLKSNCLIQQVVIQPQVMDNPEKHIE